jgi:ferric hydroxamate transport system permease protein
MASFAAVLFLWPTPPSGTVFVTAGAIAAMALAAVLIVGGGEARLVPEQVLLRGVALAAALDAVVTVALALDSNRAQLLLGFLAGSTAGATPAGAVAMVAGTAILVPTALLFSRGLAILPLGDAAARSLGLPLVATRSGLLALSALMTALSVLAAGPLTFVGLVGPHLARRLGLHGSVAELPGAALIGGLVMLLADWIGRVAFAPFELPAGLVAALIGCPYLVIQLRRRG